MTDFKELDPLRREANATQLDLVESFAQGKISRRHCSGWNIRPCCAPQSSETWIMSTPRSRQFIAKARFHSAWRR